MTDPEIERLRVELARERLFNAAVHRIARSLTSERDLDTIVQVLTDEATALCRAQFGAFFYNVIDERGEAFMLYTLSGAPRAAFSRFPLPRATPLFGATFRNEGTVRSEDIRKDPRFGAWGPQPEGHLPVVSYLAVSVVDSRGSVLGGLFFGHGTAGVFTEHDERAMEAIAPHAAIAIENARAMRAMREAEAERARSERRFRSLVSSTSQIVWTTNAAGETIEDSPAWRAFTGQTLDEFRGRGWAHAIHDDDREAAMDAWRRAVTARSTYESEYRLRHANGEYRLVASHGVPVINDDGTCDEWVGTTTDINDRRVFEQRIAHERARLSKLFLQAPAAIAVVAGPDLVYQLANPFYCRLVGKQPSQLLGIPGRRALPELVTQGVWDLLDRVRVEGEPYFAREFRAKLDRLGDGTLDEGYFDFTAEPIRDATGQIEAVLLFAMEVTGQVHARKAIEAILQEVPTPIVLVELDTARITFSNAAADALWGHPLPRAQSASDYAELYRAFDPNGAELTVDELPAVRAARGETIRGVRMDLDTPQGRRSVVVDSATVPAVPGHPATIVVSFQDVSQLVTTERALRDAVRIRDEFLSIASHELNTPLTPLKLQLGSLRSPDLSPEKIARKLDMADRQVDRLATLVGDLLEVSRITAGRMKMEPENVPVLEVALEVAERVGVGTTVPIAVDGDRAASAHVDRLRLEQVLTNLLTNAVKYGADKPIDVHVTRTDTAVIARVRDRGIGIAEEQREAIFDRFERAVSVRNFGGFGLGLWIVRQIVDAWGGSVAVESKLGEGSTFVVTMPCAEVRA